MDRNEKQQELADELVAGAREAKYGNPKVNYKRIALIWSAVLGIEVTPTQAVLCEMGVKFSRLIQSPDDEDTQVDIHGYVKVLQRLLDPEDQPASHSGIYKVKVKWDRGIDPYKVYVPDMEHVKGYPVSPENAPTITFTGEPQATMKEDEILWAKFGDGTVGPVKVYADGSKDMTFEEAVAPSILMQDPASGHVIKCDTATATSILAEKGYIQVEAVSNIPNKFALPLKNGVRLTGNPSPSDVRYALGFYPGSTARWNMGGTVDIISANFFPKEDDPCGQ